MNTRFWLSTFFLAFALPWAMAQESAESTGAGDGGRLTGNLEINANFFMRDTLIGAANTPQYDRQLFGADSWLNLNYRNWGFDIGARFDMFNNSNLLNPTGSYTDLGIGRWYVNKKIHSLDITGGYIYDIIGSGIIFRAYEERPLAIDQALFGIRLAYDLLPDWKVKGFTGRQKQQFDTYKSVLRGAAVEGFIDIDTSKVMLAPGFGVVSRTLDDGSMNNLVATLNTYRKEDIFIPKYNTYAFTFYNTLTSGPFSWYVETAYKTKDAQLDPLEERVTVSGDTVLGRYIQGKGTVFYTSLSYSAKGLGLTLEGKRTENFDFRTRPQEEGVRGLLNYIPPMARVNTYRLPARYAAATQFIGEQAVQADIHYAVNRNFNLNVNLSVINNLDNEPLYRELFTEVYYKYKRKWILTAGLQLQSYNQEVYYGEPDARPIRSITPYFDFLYRLTSKASLRFEGQYMSVEKTDAIPSGSVREDYGNWVFGLVEFTVAPHWSITVSDMYNSGPGRISPVDASSGKPKKIHYPRFDLAYTYKANRLSLSYVKQVEGIVCSGGICRLEPAFSGVKMTVNSTF